jgi:hypothetical protein
MDLIPQLVALILISFGAVAAQHVDKMREQRDLVPAKQPQKIVNTINHQ